LRILHFADVHLDRPFVGMPDESVRRRRRQDLVNAFERCLEIAKDKNVDLVTIGGDLWEEEHVRADTRNSVAHELGKLGVEVLIVCGNHDPLLPGGSYARTVWPGNVKIVPRGSLSEHSFGGVSVWSISWGGGDPTASSFANVSLPDDGRVHLLLVHGTSLSTTFAVGSDAYMPFEARLVREAGFALCLAGHVHIASHIEDVVYPGSPEPLGWGEDGRHCVALIEIDGSAPTVELIDVNETKFAQRTVDCSGCGSSAEVGDRVAAALRDGDANKLFLRVRLEGIVGADCEISTAQIQAEHRRPYAGLVIEDATEPLLDADARARRKGLEGLFVRKLQSRIQQAPTERERRVAEQALQAGLRALDRRDVILRVD
jgi:DNA repair protein SbcD/Mre11